MPSNILSKFVGITYFYGIIGWGGAFDYSTSQLKLLTCNYVILRILFNKE